MIVPPIQERSAGVIPYRLSPGGEPIYLLIHSARVRCPRARWEFPKGGIEPGEGARQAAAREFREETGLVSWRFRDGFERSLCYTYVRGGRPRRKTVTYFVAEVHDDTTLSRSLEHAEDPDGRWYVWGPAQRIAAYLCHAHTRALLAAADAWLRGTFPDVGGRGSRRAPVSDDGDATRSAAPRVAEMVLAEER